MWIVQISLPTWKNHTPPASSVKALLSFLHFPHKLPMRQSSRLIRNTFCPVVKSEHLEICLFAWSTETLSLNTVSSAHHASQADLRLLGLVLGLQKNKLQPGRLWQLASGYLKPHSVLWYLHSGTDNTFDNKPLVQCAYCQWKNTLCPKMSHRR